MAFNRQLMAQYQMGDYNVVNLHPQYQIGDYNMVNLHQNFVQKVQTRFLCEQNKSC